MKRSEFMALLHGNNTVAKAAEKLASVALNANQKHWPWKDEADALIEMLQALEAEGVIRILK